jgi:hypothetical protein
LRSNIDVIEESGLFDCMCVCVFVFGSVILWYCGIVVLWCVIDKVRIVPDLRHDEVVCEAERETKISLDMNWNEKSKLMKN